MDACHLAPCPAVSSITCAAAEAGVLSLARSLDEPPAARKNMLRAHKKRRWKRNRQWSGVGARKDVLRTGGAVRQAGRVLASKARAVLARGAHICLGMPACLERTGTGVVGASSASCRLWPLSSPVVGRLEGQGQAHSRLRVGPGCAGAVGVGKLPGEAVAVARVLDQRLAGGHSHAAIGGNRHHRVGLWRGVGGCEGQWADGWVNRQVWWLG